MHRAALLTLAVAALPTPAVAQCVRQTIFAPNPSIWDEFGTSVAVEGTTLVVGATGGSMLGLIEPTRVYARVGGAWVFEQDLLGHDTSIANDFGFEVATDGTRIAVAAPRVAVGGTFGAVYVFERVGGAWTETAQITVPDLPYDHLRFGTALDLDGDLLVVGSDAIESPVPGMPVNGAVWIFRHDGSGWQQEAALGHPANQAYTDYGARAVIANERVFVAAPTEAWLQASGSDGAVYVYESAGGTWSMTQRVVGSDLGEGDRFGAGLDAEGDRLVTSAPWHSFAGAGPFGDPPGADRAGAVYVFEHDGTAFVETAKLVDDPPGHQHYLGAAVAVAGDRLAASVPGQDFGWVNSTVHLWERSPGGWEHEPSVYLLENVGDVAFAERIAMTDDHLVLGAPNSSVTNDPQTSAVHSIEFGGACPLSSDVRELSVSGGGVQTMSLDAGTDAADDFFLVLGSISGDTEPQLLDGRFLPVSNPLTAFFPVVAYDPYFLQTLTSPNAAPLASSFGVLDGQGRATTTFTIPPASNPALVDLSFWHAFLTLETEPSLLVAFTSNATLARLVP